MYKITRLEDLAEKLGMKPELRILFDSDREAYQRFEEVIDSLLKNYKFGPAVIMTSRITNAHGRSNNIMKLKKGMGSKIYRRSTEIFKWYYGIGCEPQDYNKIKEKDLGITLQSIYRDNKYIIELLKQRHKKDIWHLTI
ncbi:hypothetical protein J4440_01915 [Candidatus Woesearchaeota archaeon]|nr:hypothetical protein [Candidatus Woesearchaeota archaeon]